MILDDDLVANLKKSKLPDWEKDIITQVFKAMRGKKEQDVDGLQDHFYGKYSRDELCRAIAWLQSRYFIGIKRIYMTNNDDTKMISFQMSPTKQYLQSLVNNVRPSHSRLT